MKKLLIYLLLILGNCLATGLVASDTLYHQPNRIFENDKTEDLNDIYSHSDGYLYFIYDSKIQKYDGRNLEDITILNQSYESFLRAKDINGTIYIYDYLGQLFYIESDTLRPYPYNSIIKEFNPYRRLIDFYFDKSHHLHISSTSSYIIIDNEGKVNFPLENNGIVKHGFFAIQKENGFLFFAGSMNPEKNNVKDTFYLLNDDLLPLSKIEIKKEVENQPVGYATKSNGDFYFSSGKGDVIYSKNNKLYNLDLGVKNINRFYIKDELLWVSTQSDGIFSFDLASNDLVSKINVGKAIIATSDFQGNLWMYQTKGGVYKLDFRKPINFSKSFSFPKINNNSLVYNSDGYTYLNSGNKIIQFNQVKIKSSSIQSLGNDAFPNFEGFFVDYQQNKWYSSRGSIYYQSKDGNANKIELPEDIFKLRREDHVFLFSSDNKIWGTYNNYFFELDSGKVLETHKIDSDEQIIYLASYRDSLLISTANSIYLKATNNLSSSVKNVIWEGENNRINPASFYIENEQLFFQFYSNTYHKYTNGKLSEIPLLSMLNETTIYQFSHNENWYFFGNRWVQFNKQDSSLYFIHPTCKENYFVNENILYWLDKGQIIGIEVDSLVKKQKLLKLIKPKVNYDDIEYDEKIHLPYNYDYIEIYMNAVSFNSDKVYYRYRLDDEMNWIKTENNKVILSALSSGNYNFGFEASEDGFNWASGDDIPIIVEFPFWRKIWFILFVFLLLLSITGVYLQFRLKRLREINQLELNQLNLEQRILKTQMNPHYLFNVISSLKYLILERDFTKANLFLSLFSKNLRSTLNYSSKKTVTIEEEVKFLKKYLNIESFRNNDQLNWKVELENDVSSEMQIPPFLIQPLVENAINHGLNELNEKQSVKIIFGIKSNYLIVRVLDNGLGFEKNFEIDGNSEKASALSILKERLAKHNQSIEENIKISIDKPTGMNLVSIKIRVQK